MCDQWMPTLQLPLTWDKFLCLPRNPAYKYEYLDGQAVLSPRPRFYHARLDLAAFNSRALAAPALDLRLRAVRPADFTDLAEVFAAAFQHLQPFGSLDEAAQLRAAQTCLERTRDGGDGPWIESASFAADSGGALSGAVLITLLPEGDPADYKTYHWDEPPPPNCLDRRLGQPHLTWIFVSPFMEEQGMGTALLAAAAAALRARGFTHLLSTFLLGNERSMLWHWRSGFDVLPHPGSFRRLRGRWGRD